MRYFFQPRNDAWYVSLFPNDRDLVCGEIAPSCCRVGSGAIERIHALNPEMRIVFLFRDPVERAWSHAMMYFRNRLGRSHIQVDDIDPDQLETLLAKHRQSVGNYARNLKRWQAVFTPQRVFVSDLEAISRDPIAVLDELYAFLGIGPAPVEPKEALFKPLLVGSHESMPPRWRSYLTALYSDMVEELNELLNGQRLSSWTSKHR